MPIIVLPPVNPQFGLSLQEMIDAISDGISNTSGDIRTKIIRWLNTAQLELCLRSVPGLGKHGEATTTIGDPEIRINSDVMWIRNVEIAAQGRSLEPDDELRLAKLYPDYRTLQGTIECYYHVGDYVLGLFRVPSEQVLVTYAYQKKPTKLVGLDAANEYSEFPPSWHPLLIQRALSTGFRAEGDYEGLQASIAQENRLELEISKNVYSRQDQKIVLGSRGSNSQTKPPTVRFPPNYPRV